MQLVAWGRGHILLTLRKEREMHAGAQLDCPFYPFETPACGIVPPKLDLSQQRVIVSSRACFYDYDSKHNQVDNEDITFLLIEAGATV